ncbi:hypothetical protein GF324_08895 [bacterium]|nr:hypothetical protein [bacterium]
MTPRSRRLSDLVWHEVRDWINNGGSRVIVPFGAQEAHGAVGLGTDTIIPDTMADPIAESIDALIAPALPYGVLRSLAAYPGSVTLSKETYRTLLNEILEQLRANGFSEFILLNGHAGNHAALKDAAWELHHRFNVRAMLYDWYFETDDLTEKFYDGPGGHSGAGETAMVLQARPQAAPEALKDHGYEDAGTLNPAIQAYPGPYPVILMEEGKGLPDYNPETAAAFSRAVIEKAIESIRAVLDRWKKLDLP